MIKPLVVIGAGGHGTVVVDALLRMGATVRAITDVNVAKFGENILGVPIIGNDEEILKLDPAAIALVLGVGVGVGDLRRGLMLRREIFDRFVKAGYRFSKTIHPTASVGGNVSIAASAQVMAGAVVQTGSKIDENCIVNTHASVDHDCHIRAHSHIAPGAVLGGGVEVGEAAHISIGAVVVPNICIGDGAVIAAGAVVTADVPPYAFVCGIPAKGMKR